MSKLQVLAGQRGFCCPLALVAATLEEEPGDLAHELGVSRQSIWNWRQALKAGDLQCQNSLFCMFRQTAPAPTESGTPAPGSSRKPSPEP